MTYAKSLSDKSANKLEEADIEEMLSIDNVVPVVHPLYEGEFTEIVLNTDHDADNNSTDNTESTGGKCI